MNPLLRFPGRRIVDGKSVAEQSKQVLEPLTKLLSVLGVVAYIGGLLVVNVHLTQHGFRWLGFFETLYITVGVWALLPLFVGFVAIGTVISHITVKEITAAVKKPTSGQGESSRQDYERINAVIMLLLLFIPLYFGLFASNGYPDIPISLGGGAPSRVRLLARDELRSHIEQIGVDFPANSTLSSPMDLFMATPDVLMVCLIGADTSLILPRNLVDGTVFN